MSYEVAILEFSPCKEGEGEVGWKERVRRGYRVLFDRNHAEIESHPQEVGGGKVGDAASAGNNGGGAGVGGQGGQGGKHDLNRLHFTAYHALQTLLLYFLLRGYTYYEDNVFALPRAMDHGIARASFFRRLPHSLNTHELYFRLEHAFDWTIIALFQYEAFHSFFAVFFVSILRLDTPQEWGLSLCGSLGEAWSVRRYWGKHWHNYIYLSFSGHVKVVTRGWVGMKRGWGRRVLENTLVFAVSGGMHSAVRWVQAPEGDVWCIAVWYVGQMVPISIEEGVQCVWRSVRRWAGVRDDDEWVNTVEKWIGYVWVAGWFMWSVPKYVHTREARTGEILRKKYAAEWAVLNEARVGNKTS